MTTATDIVNRALAVIAARGTVANLEMEQSTEAKQARILYAPTRDAMLRGAHWNFARKALPLSLLKSAPGTPSGPPGGPWNPTTMPQPPWLFEYAYPSDCLLMRYVTPDVYASGEISPPMFSTPLGGLPTAPMVRFAQRFEVAAGTDLSGNNVNVVLANVEQAIGCYTARIETESLWDPAFQDAMVYALGARLAPALTGSVEMMKIAAEQAMSALLVARANSANEGTTNVNQIPDWIAARGYSSVFDRHSYVAPWITPAFLGTSS